VTIYAFEMVLFSDVQVVVEAGARTSLTLGTLLYADAHMAKCASEWHYDGR
jgi:accessory colonization factor AcfC